jgi:hypothetical protein
MSLENPDVVGKKAIILGTAPTWRQAPWQDPDAVIMGLNDAYLLGLPRYDRWYDLHDFSKFVYRPPNQHKVLAHTMPVGTFMRPQGHLEWLAKQTCPLWVQRADPRVPHAQVFPREAIEAKLGQWFDSTPAWILAHALLEGFKEIHIYGIHLATEWEYVRQKPNMAFLCGVAVGFGVKLVVPRDSPLLQSTHRYAFELDPSLPVQAAQRKGQAVEQERHTVEKAWRASKTWYRPEGDPLLRDRRTWLAAQAQDLQQAVQWETFRKRATVG